MAVDWARGRGTTAQSVRRISVHWWLTKMMRPTMVCRLYGMSISPRSISWCGNSFSSPISVAMFMTSIGYRVFIMPSPSSMGAAARRAPRGLLELIEGARLLVLIVRRCLNDRERPLSGATLGDNRAFLPLATRDLRLFFWNDFCFWRFKEVRCLSSSASKSRALE